MDRCSDPACDGVIEDGYCSVCGLAPSSAPAAAPTPVAEPQAERPAEQSAQQSAPPREEPSAEHEPLSGRTPSGRTITARSRSTAGSRRGALGLGLVEVPSVPYKDPAAAVLDDPEVSERQRFCSSCGEPVGRGREGTPGRTKGFCRKCGHGFDFRPKLQPGELVGGQYEVLGCIAHGGLGWIYLAKDRNVSDRWVVLKGLLDSGDSEAQLAAAAERAFLAEVEHPNVVKIYNFVQHTTLGQPTGYIVMEFVGGRSLRDLVLDVRKVDEEKSLPLGQAIAYMLEVLRALGYLHGKGLLFCDFKPDNAIHSEEQLKLIDLGGVRRADDVDSAIYGTVGYQAPEIASEGPSIPSDLYTVGRALAVLTFRFKGYASSHAETLPDTAEVSLLQRFDSYDRWLRRATHRDPAARFQDAAEMADQLTGILREVLAAEDGTPRPAQSTLFGPELEPAGTAVPEAGEEGPVLGSLSPEDAALALPSPLVESTDPAAGFLTGLTGRDPEDVHAALTQSPTQTLEVKLMLARVEIGLGRAGEAKALLDKLAVTAAGDWRVEWYQALADLGARNFGEAGRRFLDLYAALPGEAATKLGLAFASECAGDLATAGRLYETVWSTDNTYVSAAFGLARQRVAHDDRKSAIAVLDSVPKLSSRYVAAQLATIVAAVRGRQVETLTAGELLDAGRRLAALDLDAERRSRLAAELLHAGLGLVTHPGAIVPDATLLDADLTERGLRKALDDTYRSLAHVASDPRAKHDLVNQANTVRPRTWV